MATDDRTPYALDGSYRVHVAVMEGSMAYAKLTDAEVREMRGLYRAGGWTLQRLAARYHVSASTIRNAVSGRSWSHAAGPSGALPNRAKLTEQDVREIRELYRDDGLTLKQIAARYRVSPGAAQAAAVGRTWARVEDPAD